MNGQGCGLGLAISHKLSIGLGYNGIKYKNCLFNFIDDGIQVNSEVNKGSEFYFIIEDKRNIEIDNEENNNL